MKLAATFSGLTLDFVHLGFWLQQFQRQRMMLQRILGLKFILRVFSIIQFNSIILNYLFHFFHFFVDGRLLSEVGCFVYYYYFGKNAVYDNETLTVDFCLDHCKTNGMKLSLLDSGKWCSCSNEMPTAAIVSNSQCSYPCSGENGTEGKCGGDYRWNIHAIKF